MSSSSGDMGDYDSALFAWFTAHGGTYDTSAMGLTTFASEDGGRGVIALRDISENHTLFSIPRPLTLSLRTSPLPRLFGIQEWKNKGLARGWAGLILCMMWEEARGVESVWDGYLASLPVQFDTPMFWSEEDLEELKATAVVDKIGKEEAEKDYAEKIVPAIQSRFDLFKPDLWDTVYTLERYHIMGSRILSRSFQVEKWEGEGGGSDEEEDQKPNAGEESNSMDVDPDPDESPEQEREQHEEAEEHENDGSDDEEEEDDPADIAMVPIADMLNARYGSENARLFYEEHTLKMVTTKPILAGEQIWNTYGNPPNSELLRRYGHVDLVPLPQEHPHSLGRVGNPADIVEIRADLIVSIASRDLQDRGLAESETKERVDWWLEQGGDDTFTLDTDLTIPNTMISLIHLITLSQPAWEKAREKGKPPKPKTDAFVLGVVGEAVGVRIGEYGTTIEADEASLSDPTISLNRRNAIIVRMGEMKILRGVLAHVSEQQERLRVAEQAQTQKISKAVTGNGTGAGAGRAKRKGGAGGGEVGGGGKKARR